MFIFYANWGCEQISQGKKSKKYPKKCANFTVRELTGFTVTLSITTSSVFCYPYIRVAGMLNAIFGHHIFGSLNFFIYMGKLQGHQKKTTLKKKLLKHIVIVI